MVVKGRTGCGKMRLKQRASVGLMPDLFELELTTTISKADSYLLSYPFLLNYFAAKASITPEEVVLRCSHAYGWMPTILDLYTKKPNIDLLIAAELFNTVKVTGTLTDAQIEHLACLVNNSLVGASKLLHFISPHKFAIWDSRVYVFVNQEKAYNHRVNNVSKYRHYLGLLGR